MFVYTEFFNYYQNMQSVDVVAWVKAQNFFSIRINQLIVNLLKFLNNNSLRVRN